MLRGVGSGPITFGDRHVREGAGRAGHPGEEGLSEMWEHRGAGLGVRTRTSSGHGR